MIKMFKKVVSLFCVVSVLSCTACSASVGDTNTNNTSKDAPPFLRISGNLPEKWADRTQLAVVRDKEIGKIMPLSFEYNDAVYVQTNLPAERLEVYTVKEPVEYKDMDVYDYSKFAVTFWSVRGVYTGDGDGNFRGDDSISRAEAVAVMARFLGIEPTEDTDSGFADVPKDSWYAPIVTAAKRAGIISQDTLFRPDDKVLRQEFLAMACRAFDSLGWLHPSRGEESVILDIDEADSYAQDIFKKLADGGYYISRVAETEQIGGTPEDPDYGYKLSPKENIKRKDTAEVLYWGISDLPVVPSQAAIELGFDKEMPRIDGSTSSYPITEAFYWSLFDNGSYHEAKPKAHSKTIESYKKLISGEADVILVPDANEEVTELAKNSGVELTYIPIADEALIFFTSVENPVNNLTTEQIKNIYLDNRYDNWKEIGGGDNALIPFCRNNDSGSHAQMEKFFLDGKEINEDIRRENTSVMMASIITDVINSDNKNPGSFALGYSMFYYFKTAGMVLGVVGPDGNDLLKLLSVDGIEPTQESISNRIYPLSTHYYAVIRADEKENSPARRFAEFLGSEAGAEIVEQAGFGATKKQ